MGRESRAERFRTICDTHHDTMEANSDDHFDRNTDRSIDMSETIHEEDLTEIFKPGIFEQYATWFVTLTIALIIALIVIAFFV